MLIQLLSYVTSRRRIQARLALIVRAQFDALELAQAFERAGVSPATALGIARAIHDIAMRDTPTQSDLDKALNAVTIRIGIMLAVGLGISVAILGTLIALFL